MRYTNAYIFLVYREEMDLTEMLKIPAEELEDCTKIPIEIFPDVRDLYKHLARTMADLIMANNKVR